MYKSEKVQNDGFIKRTFYFPQPLVTTKVRLDEMKGTDVVAIRIEFLGLDRTTKHKMQHPFKDGTVFKRIISANIYNLGKNISL